MDIANEYDHTKHNKKKRSNDIVCERNKEINKYEQNELLQINQK